jgi:hypothetical protein
MKEMARNYPPKSRRQLMAEFQVSRRKMAWIMAQAGVNSPRRLLRPVKVQMIMAY